MRWGLGILFNPLLPALPLGTLAANLIGGYLMGLAMGMLTLYSDLPPEVRLLITTGFLGGLTTFSAFSGEAVALMTRQQYGWVAAHIAAHLVGSLLMTGLGLWTVSLIKH